MRDIPREEFLDAAARFVRIWTEAHRDIHVWSEDVDAASALDMVSLCYRAAVEPMGAYWSAADKADVADHLLTAARARWSLD